MTIERHTDGIVRSTGASSIEPQHDDFTTEESGTVTAIEVIDKTEILESLATRIKAANSAAMSSAHTATEQALIAGRLLIEAKSQVTHGEWANWLTQNCDIALRTAQAYMRVAKHISQLDEPNTQRAALLSIRETLKAISTDPTAPPKSRSIRVAGSTARQRTESIFGTAAAALKDASKRLSIGVDGKKVDALRNKLNAALSELDSLVQEQGDGND